MSCLVLHVCGRLPLSDEGSTECIGGSLKARHAATTSLLTFSERGMSLGR